MGADNDNEKNLFGRPRRSSFVAASEENADFVPILPAVGSTPIPAASDVNYFPNVATGQPSLREPAPPARLVVPMRKSMTEEQIATIFVESAEMTSSEQIALLDSQVTLREDDVRTAKEFVAHLRLTKPADAQALLGELKQVFDDVDPAIAALSLTDEHTSGSAMNSVNEAITVPASVPIPESESTLATLLDSQPAVPARVFSLGISPNSRHRGWDFVTLVATLAAILIPVTAAVFTGFGSPVPVDIESMLSSSGVFAAVVALLAALPLVLLARSTSFRHALSTRAAVQRVAGEVGGAVLWTIGSLVLLVGVPVVFLVTLQGVGLQLGSIPGVASTLALFAPNAHASVLVVALIVLIGFVLASLPRRVFRAIALGLAGFTIIGPAIVIFTGLAVVATTNTGLAFTPANIVIATGIIPIGVMLFAGIESGTATVIRRDENTASGLPLYIGLAAGLGFAGWVLVAGMSPDAVGDLMVGSNPALHVVAASAELALISGSIAFVFPLILIAALTGRSLMMVTVRDDRDASPVVIRVMVVAVPLILLALDLTAMTGDITTVLPGIPFVSIPIMVIVGLMAGSSIASGGQLGRVARVINTVLTIVVMVVGLALTSWSVPGLAGVYDSSIAPLATTLGLSGTVVLVVPTVALMFSFVLSLIVSLPSAVRSNRSA